VTELTAVNKDKLMSDLRVVIADAEELLRMTADQAGDSATELRARIETRLNEAREQLAELQDSALTQVKAVGHMTDAFVHENPWKSIGIASGIGLVIGLLISRR
jgi:ElaB/YqjD/DUF883 family membrane-anchored ribosome-binding protein